MRKPTLLFLIAFFTAYAVTCQEKEKSNPKRTYTTHTIGTEKPPHVDGVLDDAAWNVVEWGGDFVEWRPDENTPPTEQTKFKIVYDRKNLYIAVKAYDKYPDSIIKRLSRRDGFVGDRVSIVLDSYHDKRTAFSFTITAAGVRGDEFVSENGDKWDESWNPVWQAATKVDLEGWTAELRIPLSQLKFGKAKEQVWGMQFWRNYFRKQEQSVWQRTPLDVAGIVSEFGELRGLIDIEPQKQLEIQPFVVTQLESYPKEEGNPFRDGNDFKLNGGLDAKIGVTNDLTLDLTVNPDFGQVEADPGAITLEAFEIFFREQRPFFVENKNIFDYDIDNYGPDNIFYSRRIGRSPQGSLTTGVGDHVNSPHNSTILGAAKFSGKTRKGWSVGLLESVTADEVATVEDAVGRQRKALIEPMTNYLVTRVQKDFNNRNGFIGGIFTATTRNLGNPLSYTYNDVAGTYNDQSSGRIIDPFLLDAKENNLNLLHKAAMTGGVDFMHQWKDRSYFINGNFIMSNVQGSRESITATQQSPVHLFQREDAGHVTVDTNRTSLTGTGGKLEGGKSAGGHWRYTTGITWRSPELELNDIGFLRQADEIRQYARANYRTLKPFGKFRELWAGISMFTTYDFDGNHNRTHYELNLNTTLKNNWEMEARLLHKPRIYSNSYLQGGPRFRFSTENAQWLFVATDDSKKLRYLAGFVNSQGKEENFSFLRFETGFTYQPFDALQISFYPDYERNLSKTQYVTQIDSNNSKRYITSGIEHQTVSAAIRLNYTINPNLTVQYYGQPFISKGIYSDFNYIVNPVAANLSDRYELYKDYQINFNRDDNMYNIDENGDGLTDYQFENPNFSFVQFRSNLVVRWEYVPGSEIYLVWSQGSTGSGNPKEHLLKSFDSQILGTKKDNIFLLKATYRFML